MRYYFIITLANGQPVLNSLNDSAITYDSLQAAEVACNTALQAIIASQDCEEEDKFLEGDFRTYLHPVIIDSSPTPPLSEIISATMRVFCESLWKCLVNPKDSRRIIIETDRKVPGEHDLYYMVDFCNDDGTPIITCFENDTTPTQYVCFISSSDGVAHTAAQTYTEAVKGFEDIIQLERKHITKIYSETY